LKDSIRRRLELNEETLSSFASTSRKSKGRLKEEPLCDFRTEYQRDRDRIIHSKAFRRIKHKTQVFIDPVGDHYVTRLTHTLEVAQIARTISRSLNLNEDLTEAMSLGHDIGHTPFGHIGEDELGKLSSSGFRHNKQSLRIVDVIEKNGQGLNLTWEVRNGILNHSKPRGDFFKPEMVDGMTLEAQVLRISDAIAYLNHDLLDAFRAGIIAEKDLPKDVINMLGTRHSKRVNTMVSDVVKSSWSATGEMDVNTPPVIIMSPGIKDAVNALREYMFQNVYVPEDKGEEGKTARHIINVLFDHFSVNGSEILDQYRWISESDEQAVMDYISGMTDRYAIRMAEKISPGSAKIFLDRMM